ncbi:MAG: nuclear transport factor 2 family protein [Chitinophagaceae bacterium]|nr:MAG: nuclear transport factor 2 family protein [Chitinophagaceae bacterium]
MHLRKLLFGFLLVSTISINAQTKDEKAVGEAVESLRKAMVDPNKTTLDKLTSIKLSYGHSSGKVEDKASFINSLVSGTSDFVSIKLSEQVIIISGNTAIVRHNLDGSTNDGGKPATVKLHVMLVWNQKGTSWQLLARQAVKLPQ